MYSSCAYGVNKLLELVSVNDSKEASTPGLTRILWIDDGHHPMNKRVEAKICLILGLQSTDIVIKECRSAVEDLAFYVHVDSFEYYISTVDKWDNLRDICNTVGNMGKVLVVRTKTVRKKKRNWDWIIKPSCGTRYRYISLNGLLQPVINSKGIVTDTVEITNIIN